jgi:endonuclease YncB( thermonuclease family)
MMHNFTRFPSLAVMILWLIPALLLFSSLALAESGKKIQLRDGDSFVLDGEEIRLWGIDAPEFFQTCRNQAGQDYSCGRQAKDHLRDLIGGRAIRCETTARAKNETRTVARCFAGADDLGQLMVRGGWAVEYQYFSKGAYTADELQAKNSKSGLWSGTFQNPRDWRKARENRR